MKHTTTYRQKDNGWQIIVSWKDTSGKWHQKSKQGFARKTDAKDAEAGLIELIKKQPQPVDRGMAKLSLLDFCDHYIKNKHSIAEGTARQYKQAVKSLKDVADKPVRKITFLDLQSAVSEWTMNPDTQKNYKSKLDILFRAAVKPYGLIANNPVPDLEIERSREKKERLTISARQFQRLCRICKTKNVQLAAEICYYAGLRRGELLALTWNDINWKNMTLTVNKQLDIRKADKPDVHPKSKNSFRTIPVPYVLIQHLARFHDTQPMNINRRIFGNAYSVYGGLERTLKKLDVKFTAHCLRHTYATNLLANGVDIRTVAALLGDTVPTVIKTYIHYTDEMRAAAARDIEKIFAQNF